MSKIREPFKSQFIEKCLQELFGPSYEWEFPDLGETIGPSEIEVFDKFDGKRGNLFALAKSRLQEIVNADETPITNHNQSIALALKEFGEDAIRLEIRNLGKPPLPIRAGFGHKDPQADFVYWGQMEHYSITEAVALSVGADPGKFDEDYFDKMGSSEKEIKNLWKPLQFLARRRNQFERKFDTRRYSGKVRHNDLKVWIDEVDLEVHSEFYALLKRRARDDGKREGTQNRSELTPQERQSLLKLIAAMACEGYKFNPNADRNTATSDIQTDVERIGQTIDQKTILKWLKEACELVHKDYWLDR